MLGVDGFYPSGWIWSVSFGWLEQMAHRVAWVLKRGAIPKGCRSCIIATIPSALDLVISF